MSSGTTPRKVKLVCMETFSWYSFPTHSDAMYRQRERPLKLKLKLVLTRHSHPLWCNRVWFESPPSQRVARLKLIPPDLPGCQWLSLSLNLTCTPRRLTHPRQLIGSQIWNFFSPKHHTMSSSESWWITLTWPKHNYIPDPDTINFQI